MRVLIIEDEEKVAEFNRKGLQQEGYAVDVVRDGEEGGGRDPKAVRPALDFSRQSARHSRAFPKSTTSTQFVR
jgi:CheY-like chemotaxis protein